MIKLIVGLGNPGDEYVKTRHNIGHFLVNLLENELQHNVEISKTTTYMNNSGSFVRRLLGQQDLTPHELLIIHDDWSFSVGVYRLQFGRGANSHKGVQSIIDILGTKEFWRLRVGIGSVPEGVSPSDYVLAQFSSTEREIIQSRVLPAILADLSSIKE